MPVSKRRSVSVSGDTYSRLKIISEKTGRAVSNILEEWIASALEEHKEKSKAEDIPPGGVILL